jgi:hypothetical protein
MRLNLAMFNLTKRNATELDDGPPAAQNWNETTQKYKKYNQKQTKTHKTHQKNIKNNKTQHSDHL